MNTIKYILEGLKMSFKAIGSNSLRAVLTMMGVATGIFAITGILTMVNSLQNSITSNLSALGNTTIFVHHWPWAENRNDWYKFIGRPKVSYRDFQKLSSKLENVQAVGYEVSARGQTIQAEGRSASMINVVGITKDQGKVKDLSFNEGRFFTDLETHLGKNVCILGSSIAEALYPKQPAVGKYVRVGKRRLMVIGVQEKQGGSFFPGMPSEDDRVYVPYNAMRNMYNLNKRGIDKVIVIKARQYEDLPQVEESTIALMRASRGLKPRMEDNFAINKQEALMNRFESIFGYLETGGWVISIFSILIGGFSIGNIMYISVKERTNEIGVQMALGSSRDFVLFQFLMEAIMLCMIGGLIGILITLGLGTLIQIGLSQTDLAFEVSFALKDLGIGLFVAFIIGLVAGLVPASMAARLDPVVAIRQS
ncbi:MAG: ABC transporter permease [Bacteroidia bacterium]|nr:ABC transporter permease [Bacteroidia bacterium]